MHLRTYYPTVVLSDIHLGTSHSKTIEVSNFLKSVNCDRLILNGDIIDGWHLRKAGTKMPGWLPNPFPHVRGQHPSKPCYRT